MTGNIFDIKQFAVHDGPGIRTTVFLKGCPMDCTWCHNPESRLLEPQQVTLSRGPNKNKTKTIGKIISSSQVMERVLKDEIFYDESNGGVTFSGGEPMMQIDFLESLLKLCRQHNIHTAIDTCGYAPWENFDRIYKLTDLFLFDLKPMDDKLHTQQTGVSNKLVHDNLKRLAELHNDIIVRLPLIPDVTDTDININSILEFLKDIPSLKRIDLLPFNKLGNDKIERYKLVRNKIDMPPFTNEQIEKIKSKFISIAGEYDIRIGT